MQINYDFVEKNKTATAKTPALVYVYINVSFDFVRKLAFSDFFFHMPHERSVHYNVYITYKV